LAVPNGENGEEKKEQQGDPHQNHPADDVAVRIVTPAEQIQKADNDKKNKENDDDKGGYHIFILGDMGI
jgi:hypothetical protein